MSVSYTDLLSDLTEQHIRDGDAYKGVYDGNIGADATKYFLIRNTSDLVTIIEEYLFVSDANIDITFYRQPDIGDTGTPIIIDNRAIGEPDNNETVVYEDPTVNDVGVKSDVDRIEPSGGYANVPLISGISQVTERVISSSGNDFLIELNNLDSSQEDLVGKIRWYEDNKR